MYSIDVYYVYRFSNVQTQIIINFVETVEFIKLLSNSSVTKYNMN